MNAFEVYVLYEVVSKEAARLNAQVEELERHSEVLETQAAESEQKLGDLLRML